MSALKPEYHHYDIVIIGAGGAGLSAAMQAAIAGFKVICVSKVHPTQSHTVAAQGGINAALGNVVEDDWRWHMYDTIRGGDWLADQDAVEYMCRNAAAIIRKLEHLGVPFSRLPDGKIYQRVYGGQSTHYGKGGLAARACAAADRTGHAILHTLYAQALQHQVHFLSEAMALDLILGEEGGVKGVLVWDIAEGVIRVLAAKMVILATGGYGQAYATNTSSRICTGDGNAMCLRAGLALQDMEFIQFHPTGLYPSGFLITEAARAEGGILRNHQGERFLEHYAPQYKELASRDVIARAIATELIEGRGAGTEKAHLWLDLRHIKETILKERLPTVLETTHTFAGLNPLQEMIPIAPSAHYTMGGIPTKYTGEVIRPAMQANEKETLVPGLMAIGETACVSVHGANRLGCNSLLDIIVFGYGAIEQCKQLFSANAPNIAIQKKDIEVSLTSIENKLQPSAKKGSSILIKQKLQQLMQQKAGVFRDEALLRIGAEQLQELSQEFTHIALKDHSLLWNQELQEWLECENLLLQAKATLLSALFRQESRGAHYRHDFPERDDEKWLYHTVARLEEEEIICAKRPVVLKPLTSEVSAIPPERRAY